MFRTDRRRTLDRLTTGLVLVAGLIAGLRGTSVSGAGLASRRIDPATVVPLEQLSPEHRATVEEVIRDHTFHRQGESDTFPCSGKLYLSLVEEPMLPLSLWKDLSDSPVQLRKVAPGRYEGNDGSGSTATWELVLQTPRQHVLLSNFNYVSPRGNARIEARIVLVVHTAYYLDTKRDPWIQHDVEAFVKVDSKGWKTLGRTLRPVIERVLEEQVREAGYFISLMTRLVMTYPDWANEVVTLHPGIDIATRDRFCSLVAQHRKPGASSGRPSVAQNASASNDGRRR